MNILIDGCVFSQNNYPDLQEAWRQFLPKLVSKLQEHQIYFLNRGFARNFDEIGGVYNLFAPLVDFNVAALEDRRLSALCQELDIDLFLSTYNTSAGILAKSLFLAVSTAQISGENDSPLLISRHRAINMAAGYLVFSHEDADFLKNVYQVPQEAIQVACCEYNVETDAEVIVEEFALAVNKLLTSEIHSALEARRRQEEELVNSEAIAIKSADQEEAIRLWSIKIEEERQNQNKFTLLRLYRAVTQPHRYFEYFKIIWRMLIGFLRPE